MASEVWTIYSPTGDGEGGYVAEHGDHQADHPGAILLRPELAIEAVEEMLRDHVPYLRHAPGCTDDSQPFEWCPCGLETLLGELRRMLGIEVARCEGCGVYAITPDGTEDWAWRERPLEPFCHGCAVASMDAQRRSERGRRWWPPRFRRR